MRDVVIVSAVRTPVGKFQGALSDLSATELGAIVVRAAVEHCASRCRRMRDGMCVACGARPGAGTDCGVEGRVE
jgi:acetyl-CoA acetyltransferase